MEARRSCHPRNRHDCSFAKDLSEIEAEELLAVWGSSERIWAQFPEP